MRSLRKLAKFCRFADDLAGLSTCKRAACGAIVFPCSFKQVYSIGYNGQPREIPNESCTGEVGTCGCVHAELNAVLKLRTDEKSLWMFSTTAPCYNCASAIVNDERIGFVLWARHYRNESGLVLLQQAGIGTQRIDDYLQEQRTNGGRHIRASQLHEREGYVSGLRDDIVQRKEDVN